MSKSFLMCIIGLKECPDSTYALRVSGWVRSKAYSCIQGGWVGNGQTSRTLLYMYACLHYKKYMYACLHYKNICMPVFIIFELLRNPAFIEDEI